MEYVEKLVKQTIWANQKWIEFLFEKAPQEEQLQQWMSHILLGEQVWFQRILNQELNHKIWKVLSFEDLRYLHQENKEIYHELLQRDLDEEIIFKRFTGEKGTITIAGILLHLSTHGFHHRGQMSSYISNLGIEPINMDYIAFSIEFDKAK